MTVPPAGPIRLPRFRIYALRWVMLVLYALLAFGFFCFGLSDPHAENGAWTVGIVLFTLATQMLFIFGAGTRNLVKPVHRKRRLLAPVVVAGALLAVLLWGMLFALDELLKGALRLNDTLMWSCLLGGWFSWAVFFFVHNRASPRYQVLRRMTHTLLAGSLLQLLACIPSHIITTRRGGCMAGLGTGIGITAGIYVALWAFGPGLALLFLRPKWEADSKRAVEELPQPPARKLNYSLGSLLLFVLWLGAMLAVFVTEREPDGQVGHRFEVWPAVFLTVAGCVKLLRALRRWEHDESA